jgi:site-specific DNA recombinase
MKAVIYARSVTRAQTQHGNSIPVQIKVCTKYAKENGFEVTDLLTDVGYSSMNVDRPGLDKMRSLIARDWISVVVVSGLACLTRSVTNILRLGKEFADKRVDLHCVTRSVGNITTRWFRARESRLTKYAQG